MSYKTEECLLTIKFLIKLNKNVKIEPETLLTLEPSEKVHLKEKIVVEIEFIQEH